jgi:hypothetical protein
MDYLDYRFAVKDVGSAAGCLFSAALISVAIFFAITLGSILLALAVVALGVFVIFALSYVVCGGPTLAGIATLPLAGWLIATLAVSTFDFVTTGEYVWFWQVSPGDAWAAATVGLTIVFAAFRLAKRFAYPDSRGEAWWA